MMRTRRVGQALSAPAAQTAGVIATTRTTKESALIEIPMMSSATAICSHFDRATDQSDVMMPRRRTLRFPDTFPLPWGGMLFPLDRVIFSAKGVSAPAAPHSWTGHLALFVRRLCPRHGTAPVVPRRYPHCGRAAGLRPTDPRD